MSSDTETHELEELRTPHEQQPIDHPTEIDALPPTDHGRGAYTALVCCTIAQAPIWGYSVAFGIFQEYYTSKSDIKASPSAIASIGASQTGIMYLMMPLAFIVLNKYPRLRPWCGPLGLLITVVSLTASAFSNEIGALIATQGVLYALGCSLLFSPISLYMDEWFVERKGMAYGVMWAGKSAVGVAMPFLFSALLQRFDLKSTLLSWAIASVLLTSPTLLFLKPRVEINGDSRPRPISFSFLRSTPFWMLQIGIMIQSLGYLMPSTYLASYATAIGLSSVTGPILLALFSLASVPGSLIHGMLGDKVSSSKVIIVSSIGSAVPVFLLWGLSRHISTMVIFVILYGFFAGGFSATWSGALQEIKGDNASIDTSLVFGMLLGGRGVGFVVAGPLSGALVSAGSSISGAEALGYATKYGPMILCTGITAILGAWSPLWKATKVVRSKGIRACMPVTPA
ncbi:major facilitator superfamily domain-containing protein [Thelonectria olida]|uniref:Major facilitator superfamily domain-containing protein n=1 Tax=Thelonectria olida TaxID=1576542 RepID=A0A9P8W303_9HYPO|nr:major facilitator superfamily domain-containing protein [Thelonectria olida]